MMRTCKRKPRQGESFLPNEIFILGLSAGEIAVYAYLLFAGLPPRKAGKKGGETRLGLVRACEQFAGQVRKRHQRNPRQALLGQCDPAVSESGSSGQPQVRESWFRLHSERGG